ncbi:MAG: hypothetical protein NC131_11540 [Roseburia sp.]|nr:hypothetical protein [Roseburia sp.]
MSDYLDYEPFNNEHHNTIWEYGRMISDQIARDNPEVAELSDHHQLAQYGMPLFTRWLFIDGAVSIPWNDDVWLEFAKMFIVKYLNRVPTYRDVNIFRFKLSDTIMSYQEFIETTGSSIYNELIGADGKLTETETTSYESFKDSEYGSVKDRSDSGDSTRDTTNSSTGTSTDKTTNNTTHTGTSNTAKTGTEVADSSQSNVGVKETSTRTPELTTETKRNGTDTTVSNSTANGRNLTSDTPQSIVNASTIGNPELQSWKYASGMVDSNATNKTDTTLTRDTTDTQNTTGSETNVTEKEGSVDTDTTTTYDTNLKVTNNLEDDSTTNSDRSSSLSGTEKITDTSTRTSKETDSSTYSKNSKGDETRNLSKDNENPYRILSDKYELFLKHMRKPLYLVIDKCEKLFFNEYVDERRMEYLSGKEIEGLLEYMKEG